MTVARWALATAAIGGWVAAILLWRSVYLLRRALEQVAAALARLTARNRATIEIIETALNKGDDDESN